MKTRAVQGVLLAALLAGAAPNAAHAANEIKAGKWQFTTQMQTPAASPSSPGAQAQPAANPGTTDTACIDPTRPVPTEMQQGNVQCKLDKMERNGGNVTWTMTCNSPQGPIPTAGSARFSGNTMEATLTARVPGPNGQPVNTPGRITGRYLGPCDTK
jgi:Protein of unknown function (DUF3617)